MAAEEAPLRYIAIDTGSGYCKAGFSSDVGPRVVFPSIVGRPNHSGVIMGGSLSNAWVGEDALAKKDVLRLKYPIERGIVSDWDDMERIWHYAFYNQLKVVPENFCVMLTKPLMNPVANTERMVQMMFETFNVSGLNIYTGAVLSVFAGHDFSGVVLDSGFGVTHSVAVINGCVIPRALNKLDLAGCDLTEYMMKLLTGRGYSFTSSSDREVARDIKEKLAYISSDFEGELESAESGKLATLSYKLPTGQEITIGSEAFRCPEALFRPSVLGMEEQGVAEMIIDTINKCDQRDSPYLYGNIVLSGGSTMFAGFKDRLMQELEALKPTPDELYFNPTPERKNSAWIGASKYSPLSWCRRQEYNELGPAVISEEVYM